MRATPKFGVNYTKISFIISGPGLISPGVLVLFCKADDDYEYDDDALQKKYCLPSKLGRSQKVNFVTS